jgi:hypothetical protein
VGVWIAIIATAAIVTWRLRRDPVRTEDASVTDDLPPDIRRDLHSDAVRLNKQQLWIALPAAIVAAMAVPLAFVMGRVDLEMRTIAAAGVVLAWAIRTCLEWRRLRQIDPYRYE